MNIKIITYNLNISLFNVGMTHILTLYLIQHINNNLYFSTPFKYFF